MSTDSLVRHPVIAEVIRRAPQYAFRRRITTRHLQRILGREHGFCTWCNVRVKPPRVSWCGKACIKEAAIYMNDDIAAKVVVGRDGRQCTFCGIQDWGYEVDHITPVCLGGGLCGPGGLRVLCRKCHRILTNDLNRHLTRYKLERIQQ